MNICCISTNGRADSGYTVYVPFLPQHYRDRAEADSIAEESEKQMFINLEAGSMSQDGNPKAAQHCIIQHLKYAPILLGDKQQVKGVYSIRINSLFQLGRF